MPEEKRIHTIKWTDFEDACWHLTELIHNGHAKDDIKLYGVPTGGTMVAIEIRRQLLKQTGRLRVKLLEEPEQGCLVVDDLVDSGATLERLKGYRRFALYRKPHSPDVAVVTKTLDGWIHLPWENTRQPDDAVRRLLQFVGEDPRRNGLVDTPARVLRALDEMTSGYRDDPEDILTRQFDADHDEMIILRDVAFTSLCEHHMLPFQGTATVAYIPQRGKVVGISKLARLVECFAKRLQVQERLTTDIANAIELALSPLGVAVVVKAVHSCMSCRGVKQTQCNLITSAVRGVFRADAQARNEFLSLIR